MKAFDEKDPILLDLSVAFKMQIDGAKIATLRHEKQTPRRMQVSICLYNTMYLSILHIFM